GRADVRAATDCRERWAAVDLCGGTRRSFYRGSPGLRGPLGQGSRQGHLAGTASARFVVSPGTIRPRVSVLLARGRGSADPVSAAQLVYSYDVVCRSDAGEQSPGGLAAGSHSGRPLWKLFGVE